MQPTLQSHVNNANHVLSQSTRHVLLISCCAWTNTSLYLSLNPINCECAGRVGKWDKIFGSLITGWLALVLAIDHIKRKVGIFALGVWIAPFLP